MNNCVACRYWESDDLDTDDGTAICLKQTEATMNAPSRLVVIRTRGDDTCEMFRQLARGQRD